MGNSRINGHYRRQTQGQSLEEGNQSAPKATLSIQDLQEFQASSTAGTAQNICCQLPQSQDRQGVERSRFWLEEVFQSCFTLPKDKVPHLPSSAGLSIF